MGRGWLFVGMNIGEPLGISANRSAFRVSMSA